MAAGGWLLLAFAGDLGACRARRRIADFYKGKTVTLVVGSSTGGGYDTVARAIARFIGKHIPGNPNVVVRNMPGAGGMTATNFTTTAPRRTAPLGLVQTTVAVRAALSAPRKRATIRQNSTGSAAGASETGMLVVWHAAPVQFVDDLKKREITVGASGVKSTPPSMRAC